MPHYRQYNKTDISICMNVNTHVRTKRERKRKIDTQKHRYLYVIHLSLNFMHMMCISCTLTSYFHHLSILRLFAMSSRSLWVFGEQKKSKSEIKPHFDFLCSVSFQHHFLFHKMFRLLLNINNTLNSLCDLTSWAKLIDEQVRFCSLNCLQYRTISSSHTHIPWCWF